MHNNSCSAIIKPSFRDELEQKKQVHCINDNVSVATADMLMHTNRKVNSYAKRDVKRNQLHQGVVPLMSHILDLETEVVTLQTENRTLNAQVNTLKAENNTLNARVNTLEAENITSNARVNTLEGKTSL